MYKVPRERTKERKRPFVHSARFKPPLKTLFALRKCVFRERRRIESRETLLCGWVENESKEESFPTKTVFAKREEGVVGGVDFFVLSFLKKAFIIQSKLAGGEKEPPPKRERSTKKKEWKKRTKKHGQRKLHFSKQTEREKNNVCILTKESILQLVLSQTRSFEEEERGQREASSFS